MSRESRRGEPPDAPAALRFRAPGSPLPALELLRRALPSASREDHIAGLRRGELAVDGVALRREEAVVAAGSAVEIVCADAARVLAASLAGLEGEGALRALVAPPPWPSGELTAVSGVLCFEQVEQRGAVAELRLDWAPAPERASRSRSAGPQLAAPLELLASLGHAVIGDLFHGGVLADGGLRLAAADAELDPGWWPAEPLLLGRSPRAGGRPPSLTISQQSARVLERGHPWVLRDADSGDVERFRAGALVQLESTSGQAAGLALIDGEATRVARRWAAPGARAQSIEARVDAALERRAALLEGDETDALRLVHGEADGLPGLAIDRLGGVLRVLVHSRSALLLREAACEAARRGLRERTGIDAAVVEIVHLRRPRSAGVRLACARQLDGKLEPLDADGRLVVRERGLRFAVDLGLADPMHSTPGVGLFLDQRDNRARLARCAASGPDGPWLNLFAHTGAFSAALLAAGAPAVTSVDLSARYLRWLDHNLALNRDLGVDPGHHTGVRRDGRRFLAELGSRERFAGIVLDPPTAAAVGRRYWSIRKDLQPLIEKSLEHLEAGGWLLVARNDRAARGPSLRAAVLAAAERTRVALHSIEPAAAGPDFPSLAGFPEGDPFRAVLVQTERRA